MKFEKFIMDCVKNETAQTKQEGSEGQVEQKRVLSTSKDTENLDLEQMFLQVDREIQEIKALKDISKSNDAMDVFTKIIELDLNTLNVGNLKFDKRTS